MIEYVCVCVCVRACVRSCVCVCVCVRACARVFVHESNKAGLNTLIVDSLTRTLKPVVTLIENFKYDYLTITNTNTTLPCLRCLRLKTIPVRCISCAVPDKRVYNFFPSQFLCILKSVISLCVQQGCWERFHKTQLFIRRVFARTTLNVLQNTPTRSEQLTSILNTIKKH